jgi:hypothetical protein
MVLAQDTNIKDAPVNKGVSLIAAKVSQSFLNLIFMMID